MRSTVGVEDARQRLGELVTAASMGEITVISLNGMPAAKLGPLDLLTAFARPRGARKIRTDSEPGALVQSLAVPARWRVDPGAVRYAVSPTGLNWEPGDQVRLMHADLDGTAAWLGDWKVLPPEPGRFTVWDIVGAV
jgi:antitoxin (DNA-binding transcriptional repressor) of toxin-antitoxin stability system